MRMGLYLFATFTLMAIFGILAYTINPNNFIIELMGINFNFPIAVWVVLPMFVLLLFTLGHMFFYGLKNYFILKKWKKDTGVLEDALYWSLLNEPKKQKYATEALGNSALLLGKASINISDNVDGLTPRLSHAVNIIRKIKNGEYIDLQEEKMSNTFTPGNPILIKNRLNCLESDETFVENVMKNTANYSEVVQAQALEIFAKKKDFIEARKYAKVFDIKSFFLILDRMTPQENMGLSAEILTEFVNFIEFQCSDFIKIALVTKKHFKPDANLILFKNYQIKDDEAQYAYLYLLFEYELIDQVTTYLDEQEEDEFIRFRALHTLKKEYNKYKLEDIIDINSICTEVK